jgi:hypothetical protein
MNPRQETVHKADHRMWRRAPANWGGGAQHEDFQYLSPLDLSKKEPRIPKLTHYMISYNNQRDPPRPHTARRHGHANQGQVTCLAFAVSPACFP